MVHESVRDAEEEKLLERFADDESLVAGYRIIQVLERDPRWHTTFEAAMANGRRVLLKVVEARAGESRRSRNRRHGRLRLRASLQHPHLIPVLDWGKAGKRLYIALALCNAPSLAVLLEAGPLAPTRAIGILGQLADALEVAHARGLVHRDLVPERVLLEPQGVGHVLLGDFGAADPDWSSGLVDPAAPRPYLSPEGLRGDPLTPASNVYSMTCMLVECLTGSPPQRSRQSAPRLSMDHPELPPSLDDVVEVGMAEDPAERLSSPRQLVSAAAVALGVATPESPAHADGRAAPEEPASEVEPERPRAVGGGRLASQGGKVLALALAAAVACGGAGFLVGRSADDPVDPATKRSAAPQADRRAGLRATDRALERLDARRAILHRRLVAAGTLSARADAAERLVQAYRSARRSIPRTSRPEAHVAAALEQAGRAYGRLATAARGRARTSYVASERAVRRAEADLAQAILSLSARR